MSRPNSLSQFKEHRFDTAQVATTKTQIGFYIYMQNYSKDQDL